MAPKGTASNRKLSQAECDKKFAGLFGGEGAIVGSVKDPPSLGNYDNYRRSDEQKGKKFDTVPRPPSHGPAPYDNPDKKSLNRGGIIHLYGDARGDTFGPLYTPRGGRVERSSKTSIRVHYRTGLSITFVHATYIKVKGVNNAGLRRIGIIGVKNDPSQSGKDYIHVHMVFYSNFGKRERVDPREVFCGW